MSKERLEEIIFIEQEAKRYSRNNDLSLHLAALKIIYKKGHLNWLIEQAERVQELEEENKQIRQMKYHEAYEQGKFDTNMKVWYELPKLEQQNKELLEDLATIGNAIHEGEISGRGTDENLILEIVDKHWRNRNE